MAYALLVSIGLRRMQAVYDAKSEEIGPGIYRFKAEIGQSCHMHASLHVMLHATADKFDRTIHTYTFELELYAGYGQATPGHPVPTPQHIGMSDFASRLQCPVHLAAMQ